MAERLAKRPLGYWNPRTELMPRDDIRRLQLRKFQVLLTWAYERSPFWRRKLEGADVSPNKIKSFEDIQRVPFLTKTEMLQNQVEHPPYGDMLTAPASLAVAYHHTSGTSGRTPLRVLETARDWNWGANAWACAIYAFGLRATDIVYLPFGYGPFIGFWGAHYAVQKIGAMTVAGGGLPSETRIRQIIDMGATAIVSTPSYAIRLTQVAREMGVDLAKDTSVELLLHAGEPGANIPATKTMIEAAWGAHAGDFAGMTETAGISCYECNEKPGGIHVMEDHFLEEVIDPITGELLPLEATGERVTTAFGIGILPIIRYRTGDMVKRVPASRCRCGRTFDLYEGGIIGRTDDMKIVRGVNVHPSAVEGIVRRHPAIREFRILVNKVNMIDEITVELDPNPEVAVLERDAVADAIRQELAEAHEGLRFNVELVEPGALPTFELKARRLADRR